MIPWSLVLVLLGLGMPAIPADVAQRVRTRAVLPNGYCSFGVGLNSSGRFTMCTETPAEAEAAHRRLRLRRSRGPVPASDFDWLSQFPLLEGLGRGTLAIARILAAPDCYRRWVVLHPDDAAAMVHLGELLDAADRPDEAEGWFRQATRTAPRDWLTWHALAEHHVGRVVRSIVPMSSGNSADLIGAFTDPRIQAELVRAVTGADPEVLRRLRAANDCYDWAVLLAPDAVEPYAARLIWTILTGLFPINGLGDDLGTTAGLVRYSNRITADAERVADLSGHPLAYGVAVLARVAPERLGPDQGPPKRKTVRYWERAAARLEAMRRDPDPRTRADATRVLILVRCMVFEDFAGGERLLRELWVNPTDPTVLNLAHLVYGGLEDSRGMIELADRRLKVRDDPYDHFIRAKCFDHRGDTAAARAAAGDGLRTNPVDLRLTLMRTGLLLQHGTAADLPEVHLRLTALEAAIMRRLARGTAQLTDRDRDLLQLARLHRAVYLGLLGRTPAAATAAWEAASLSTSQAETARELARDLVPTPSIAFPAHPATILPAGVYAPFMRDPFILGKERSR